MRIERIRTSRAGLALCVLIGCAGAAFAQPLNAEAARAMPGVAAVLTGADLVGWRYERPFTFLAPPPGADGAAHTLAIGAPAAFGAQ